jgi:hypothetical protein
MCIFGKNINMKCPHCLVEVNESFKEIHLGADCITDVWDDNEPQWGWNALVMNCPNEKCGKIIIDLACYDWSCPIGYDQNYEIVYGLVERKPAHPITRPYAPAEVDRKFADDYNEACLVLSLSPKASAALSRRCLQNLLRDKACVKKPNLSQGIDEVIRIGGLPSYLSENLDAIRVVGNFAAHPMKSTSTGEIIDVEADEAELCLDVLKGLFDHYFVGPAKARNNQNKKTAINKKLADAGKQELK